MAMPASLEGPWELKFEPRASPQIREAYKLLITQTNRLPNNLTLVQINSLSWLVYDIIKP